MSNQHTHHPRPDALELQARRIRWKTGLTGSAARLMAALAYGEVR